MTARHLITKRMDEAHYTKRFQDGSYSDRMIHPKLDGTEVLTSKFVVKAGFCAVNVHYPTNETVVVVSGMLRIWEGDGPETADARDFGPGSFYHLPAGVPCGLRMIEDGVLVCTWSATKDGPLPDDPLPEGMTPKY